jgi:hypothetical protein
MSSGRPCRRAQTSSDVNSLFDAAILKIKKTTNLYYHKKTEHRIYLTLWHELLTLGFVKVTCGTEPLRGIFPEFPFTLYFLLWYQVFTVLRNY